MSPVAPRPRIVLDTGALVRLQVRKGQKFLKLLEDEEQHPVVPSVVLSEWYQGGSFPGASKVLSFVEIWDVSGHVARLAGQARHATTLKPFACACGAEIPKAAKVPSGIDAIVVACASQLTPGGRAVVYTADLGDLTLIRDAHPAFSQVDILPLP